MSDIIYTNPAARSWISTRQTPAGISETLDKFHNSLPGFQRTRLVSLDAIAKELGVKNVFVKDETLRMGLPAFKILGASWAINRAIVKACNLPSDVGLEELGAAARAKSMKLYTATEGNHGRAVAKTARILGLEAMIFVPDHMVQPTRDFIASEGARVMVVEGSYDVAVSIAVLEAEKFGGTLIQDTAYESYEEVPEVSRHPLSLIKER
jgi:diaminopropionate ammonia-lyase